MVLSESMIFRAEDGSNLAKRTAHYEALPRFGRFLPPDFAETVRAFLERFRSPRLHASATARLAIFAGAPPRPRRSMRLLKRRIPVDATHRSHGSHESHAPRPIAGRPFAQKANPKEKWNAPIGSSGPRLGLNP